MHEHTDHVASLPNVFYSKIIAHIRLNLSHSEGNLGQDMNFVHTVSDKERWSAQTGKSLD